MTIIHRRKFFLAFHVKYWHWKIQRQDDLTAIALGPFEIAWPAHGHSLGTEA